MDCAAFLIGKNTKETSPTHDIARRAGFSVIKPFLSLADVETQTVENPICFFLFEEVSDISSLNKIIKPIRSCKRHKVRFFPLIYLCDAPSPKTIKQCITTGFDDIIINPKNSNHTNQRLLNQLDKAITYFETDSFFGPDRRRIADKNLSKNSVMRGKEECLQFKFHRNHKTGISIQSKIVQAA